MMQLRGQLQANQSIRAFGPPRRRAFSCPAPTRIVYPVTCRTATNSDVLLGAGLSPDEAHRVLAACPSLADGDLLATNLNFLRTIYRPHLIAKLVSRRPEVFTAQLAEWHQFLTGYGLDDEGVWKVLRYSPGLLLRRRQDSEEGDDGGGGGGDVNTPYNAGAAIMWLKSYGWTDEEVVARLLPCYPEVLAATTEQMQAAMEFLRSRSFDDEAITRMVRTFPPLLVAPYNEPLLQLIDRIRISAHNKYVVSGSYHV
ncbi:hypothetical protein PLESTB_000023100 [Pleodorina starrii]|uniref:Uncharacterized protein n=1 Tax=Pleodorina starrii TaxID=330485 RepID=A0A9W6B8P3_9CHLO|nr:hypothetical protein PLESTM_001111700 [Pleodorina starrii]GLC47763.1 hypothetical protein PLESTB_000023100 [Pleodorina starrii]GLC70824.1 hypothetical protein PLESTF_001036900 [Pleodorina starrii]